MSADTISKKPIGFLFCINLIFRVLSCAPFFSVTFNQLIYINRCFDQLCDQVYSFLVRKSTVKIHNAPFEVILVETSTNHVYFFLFLDSSSQHHRRGQLSLDRQRPREPQRDLDLQGRRNASADDHMET